MRTEEPAGVARRPCVTMGFSVWGIMIDVTNRQILGFVLLGVGVGVPVFIWGWWMHHATLTQVQVFQAWWPMYIFATLIAVIGYLLVRLDG